MANNAILTSQGNIDVVPKITTEQGSSIISRTHIHTTLAMAVLAIGLSQDIKAQEVQKETTPPVAATAEKPVSKEIPGATITFEFRVPEKKEEVKKSENNPSPSVITRTDKKTESGQMASNGDSFEEFLKKYGNKALDEAEKLVDGGKWIDADYDQFVKYKKILIAATVNQNNQIIQEGELIVNQNNQIIQEGELIVNQQETKKGEISATVNQNNQIIQEGEVKIQKISEGDKKIADQALKVFPLYQALLEQYNSLQSLSPEAKGMIKHIAEFKVPPPALTTQAINFMKYI